MLKVSIVDKISPPTIFTLVGAEVEHLPNFSSYSGDDITLLTPAESVRIMICLGLDVTTLDNTLCNNTRREVNDVINQTTRSFFLSGRM